MATPPEEAKKTMSAQEQARLRRERRNAKIAAGGASRLAAITSLSGRPAPEPEEARIAPSPQTSTSGQASPSPARQQPPHAMQQPPFDTPDSSADPMLAMLQQMLQAQSGDQTPGGGPPPDSFAGLPPGLAQMLGAPPPPGGQPGGPPSDPFAGLPPGLAQMLGAGQSGQATLKPQTSYAYVWRIVHAVFSLVLGFYVAVGTGFTGSERGRGVPADGVQYHFAQRLFLIFATAEVGLQTTRYFLERGQLPASGMLGKVAMMAPEPWAGYVRVVGRYAVIWNTIVADAMAVVFALGVVAWWNGGK
ncbi:hypothetical protein P152DRAFT_449353 [Eremomyces bilateralis CBS 781.70]|uniref:GET complex, subunit GET2 n=1 Tax=Eremomyces bilateralis CBS 781.70 TaxID=1392243 RepID=A0A6G1G3L4_9PEZI|nr:uncharacterized protein P152DRAFT_449353 [Eremomyces bilateralis CBS 781.70]KAF1812643.1 hypothetical protein P152DRAFT_449353 [Eremomyces bilateralis CBS 781.70]